MALLAMGGLVMLLWNAVLPELLAVRRIDYPRALGLLLLCRILFGRIGGGGWGGGGHPGWRQKWRGMNEEERVRFREEWQRRCAREKGEGQG